MNPTLTRRPLGQFENCVVVPAKPGHTLNSAPPLLGVPPSSAYPRSSAYPPQKHTHTGTKHKYENFRRNAIQERPKRGNFPEAHVQNR